MSSCSAFKCQWTVTLEEFIAMAEILLIFYQYVHDVNANIVYFSGQQVQI